MDDERKVRRFLERCLSEASPGAVVVVDSDDAHAWSHALLRALAAPPALGAGKLFVLPDPTVATAGDCVDRMRVALTTIDVALQRRIDVLLVPNVMDVASANKSLPSQLAALHAAHPRCKTLYVVEARADVEARKALQRRDYLRLLGPTVVPLANADPKAYFRALDGAEARAAPTSLLATEVPDPELAAFVAYDAVAEQTGTSLDAWRGLSDAFLASVALDAEATHSSHQDALQGMAAELRRRAVAGVATSRASTQVLTRCGLHANLARQLHLHAAHAPTNPDAALLDAALAKHVDQALRLRAKKSRETK